MKTRYKIPIIVLSILLPLFLINPAYSEEPTYALDCPIMTHKFDPNTQSCEIWWDSIVVAGPIMASIITMLLVIPYVILKKKEIPPRKYMLVISAGILLFFGISSIHNGLSVLTPERFEQEPDYRITLIGALIPIAIGAIPTTLGIIALKKAKLRIRK